MLLYCISIIYWNDKKSITIITLKIVKFYEIKSENELHTNSTNYVKTIKT